MSRFPKATPPPPRSSSTFQKASEKLTEQAPPEDPSPVSAGAPGFSRTVRPPPPPPSRPSQRVHISDGSEKSTIHLGDGDIESLSSLAVKTPFSIRRGLVLGGRFRVNQLIGAGAQCYVYSAEHTTLKSPVAIKCLQPQLVTPDLVERFAREAQALTAIRNAHVAAVLDVGRAPCGTPFIVMEYLEGRDLSALLETRPRLDPRQAAEILLQTCEGLAAAHALGLVHQDIKPSNIFLSDEMGIVKAKVVDFGVARVSVAGSPSMRPRFTRSQLDDTVGGTPFYMPPEQFFSDSVIDPRSDIFSLGMVLYEMLRGTHAFDLEMSTRLPGAAVRIEPAGIDPGLVAVIERCLEQKPQDRFDSVAELAVALLPYAPSRSRSHAEAAAALLRKAGLSVKSTMPSSIPPPMGPRSDPAAKKTASTLSEPIPPPRARAAPSRWPMYAGIAIVVVALGAAAVGRSLWASKSPAGPPAPTVVAAAAPATNAPPAIAIGAVVRTTLPEAPASAASVTTTSPSSTAPMASGAFGLRANGAPGPGASAGRPAPGTKNAAAGASGDKPATSAPSGPQAPGASDELGF